MQDFEILKLYLDRDKNAIRETLNKYGNFCKSISMNILNNSEDAERCAKYAINEAWNTIPPQMPLVFSAFIGKTARSISFNKYRQYEPKKYSDSETPLILGELGDIVSDKESVEDKTKQIELIKAVDDFLYSLSVYKRNIFVRRYWYSDSISGIAQKYRHSEKSVSCELLKLRKRLREHLAAKGFESIKKDRLYELLGEIDVTAVESAGIVPEKKHPIRRILISVGAALLIGFLIAMIVLLFKR